MGDRAQLAGAHWGRPRCTGAAMEAGLQLAAAAAAHAQADGGASHPAQGTQAQTMSRAAAPPPDMCMLVITTGPITKVGAFDNAALHPRTQLASPALDRIAGEC